MLTGPIHPCNSRHADIPPLLQSISSFLDEENNLFSPQSQKRSCPQTPNASTKKTHVHKKDPVTTSAAFKNEYQISRQIGQGAHGVVHAAIRIETSEVVAVKIVKKGEVAIDCESEASLLGQINHPNIIRLREIKQSFGVIYMIMDMAHGGDLFDRVQDGPLGESSAVVITKQILEAVAYLHERGIMHRDIKPENVLIGSPGGTDVLIADFGVAVQADWATDSVGSLQYAAPEVLGGRYNKAADMWSVGIVLHILLLGYPPFTLNSAGDLRTMQRRGAVDLFGYTGCEGVSPEAKDLVRRLLVVDPEQRMTARDALRHPWICSETSQNKRCLASGPVSSIASSCQSFGDNRGSHSTYNERSKSMSLFVNVFPNSPTTSLQLKTVTSV